MGSQRGPSIDEMAKVSAEHMNTMALMMQMMGRWTAMDGSPETASFKEALRPLPLVRSEQSPNLRVIQVAS